MGRLGSCELGNGPSQKVTGHKFSGVQAPRAYQEGSRVKSQRQTTTISEEAVGESPLSVQAEYLNTPTQVSARDGVTSCQRAKSRGKDMSLATHDIDKGRTTDFVPLVIWRMLQKTRNFQTRKVNRPQPKITTLEYNSKIRWIEFMF